MALPLTLCVIDRPELLFYKVGKINPILQDFTALKWERVPGLQHIRSRGSADGVLLSYPCCILAPVSPPRSFLTASERLGQDLTTHCSEKGTISCAVQPLSVGLVLTSEIKFKAPSQVLPRPSDLDLRAQASALVQGHRSESATGWGLSRAGHSEQCSGSDDVRR